MKKYWSIIITVLIIPLFVLSGLICCCFSNDAAAEQIPSSCHSDIHENQNNDTSRADDSCDCASVELLIPKNISNIQAVTLSNVQQIVNAASAQRHYFQVNTVTMAFHEPPNLAGCFVPLYLQNSNLQL